MTFKIIDELTMAGNLRNEDHYAYSDTTVLLLDGATGLTENTPDASRFVRDYTALFMDAMAADPDLCQAINTALKALEQRYRSEGLCVEGCLLPSAALLALHLKADRLQLIAMGDCTALIKGKDGITTIHRPELERLDDAVKAEAVRIRQQTGQDIREIMKTPPIRDMLYRHRMKMNAPDGYETLAFNMRPRTQADILEFDPAQIHEIVLFSDGFEAMDAQLRENTPSLMPLYTQLRAEEQLDSSLNRNPRFKLSDDATALVIHIDR